MDHLTKSIRLPPRKTGAIVNQKLKPPGEQGIMLRRIISSSNSIRKIINSPITIIHSAEVKLSIHTGIKQF